MYLISAGKHCPHCSEQRTYIECPKPPTVQFNAAYERMWHICTTLKNCPENKLYFCQTDLTQMQIPLNHTEDIPPQHWVDHTTMIHNLEYMKPLVCASWPQHQNVWPRYKGWYSNHIDILTNTCLFLYTPNYCHFFSEPYFIISSLEHFIKVGFRAVSVKVCFHWYDRLVMNMIWHICIHFGRMLDMIWIIPYNKIQHWNPSGPYFRIKVGVQTRVPHLKKLYTEVPRIWKEW